MSENVFLSTEEAFEGRVQSCGMASEEAFEGRFQQLRSLGRGSFGEALLAREESTGRVVVLKLSRCTSKDGVIESLQEVIMLKMCRSDYIVRYIDSFQMGCVCFAVTTPFLSLFHFGVLWL